MTVYQSLLASHVVNILNSVDDGVYVTDKEGTTLYVNSMYTKLTGLNSEELMGQNVRDLREKGIFDTILNPVIVKTHKPETSVQTLQDGKRVVLRGFPVFDDNRELILVFTLVRDVTFMEQMRVQISQQKNLLSLYQNQLEFLYAKDTESNNPQSETLSQLVKRAASTETTILLRGEPGVGKGLVARLIHDNGPRKNDFFLKVDCSNLTQSVIESELFGYVPEPVDAFTRADSDGKMGCFEMAHKGTVFLDEIAMLPLTMQAKLLRILQNQEIMRVGSVSQKIDVCIIAASNANLENEMQKGNFNKDLYNGLHQTVIDIPPLHETPKMIPVLVNYFLERYGAKYNKKAMCPDETMSILSAYQWPGNTQELKNTIQNLIMTCEGGEILPQNLPPSMHASKAT